MTSHPLNFEAALKELEDITRWFESSDADLDHGLAKYERGMELATQLRSHLATVENRVEKIKARFATGPDGGPTPIPAPDQPAPAVTNPAAPDDEQVDLFG